MARAGRNGETLMEGWWVWRPTTLEKDRRALPLIVTSYSPRAYNPKKLSCSTVMYSAVPCGAVSSDEELEAWGGGGHLCRSRYTVLYTMECAADRSHALEADREMWMAPKPCWQSKVRNWPFNHLCNLKAQVDKKIHIVWEYSLKVHVRMMAYRGRQK